MSSLSNFNLQTWPLKKLRALPNFFGMHMHITVTTPRPPLAAVLLKSAVWESLNDFPPCEGLGEEGKATKFSNLFVFLSFCEESENEKMRKKIGVTVTTYHNTVTPHSPTLSLKQGSDACGGGYECTSLNGLILNSKNSLFQNKAIKSKTFLLKMSFSCMRI